jgi:hypothetical protein
MQGTDAMYRVPSEAALREPLFGSNNAWQGSSIRGAPRAADLLQHDCLLIRFERGEEPYAWELERGKKKFRVPVHALRAA